MRPNPIKHLPIVANLSFLKNVNTTPTKQILANISFTGKPLKISSKSVSALPRLHPIIKQIDCISVNIPTALKLTVIKVEAVELCIAKVVAVPVRAILTLFLANLLILFLTLEFINFCKFSPNIFTPISIIPMLAINNNISLYIFFSQSH